MKRFHVHVAVDDLGRSIGFYSTLFGVAPTVEESDYAKWMLDDPRVNFAISSRRPGVTGLDHLGIQVDTEGELAAIDSRLKQAEVAVANQTDAACCYARSDKAWSHDPSGISWETFFTRGAHTVYGSDFREEPRASACCAPAGEARAGSACCG